MQTVQTLIRRHILWHSAASDLGLHPLPMSHLCLNVLKKELVPRRSKFFPLIIDLTEKEGK